MAAAPSADVEPIFLRVPRPEIGYVKFVFESYEGVAVLRTLDSKSGLIVVLAVPDFLDTARAIVQALHEEGVADEVSPDPEVVADLLGPDINRERSSEE